VLIEMECSVIFSYSHQLKKNVYLLILNSQDSQVGVLRVWNVSRATPLDNFKLKKTGFHALHVLNSPPAKKCMFSYSPFSFYLNVCVQHHNYSYWFWCYRSQPLAQTPLPRITTPPPLARLCLHLHFHGTKPSPSHLGTLSVVSWMEELDCMTWVPKSGTSCGIW